MERRIDLFLNDGGQGFGVLGGGANFGLAQSAASALASSLQTVTPPSGASGLITDGGQIGALQLDVSRVADVQLAAGTPDATADGTFGAPGFPNYTALGYACTDAKGPGLQSLTGNASGKYCQTVYYLDSNTGLLEALWTASATYSSAAGTRPGMSLSEAQTREGQRRIVGCRSAIILGFPASPTSVEIDIPQSPQAGQPADVVSDIEAESNHNRVGLLFC